MLLLIPWCVSVSKLTVPDMTVYFTCYNGFNDIDIVLTSLAVNCSLDCSFEARPFSFDCCRETTSSSNSYNLVENNCLYGGI